MRSAIQHLAVPRSGDVIAAALASRTVSTWRMETGEQIAEFDSEIDVGGSRLAISGMLGICLVGSFRGRSLAAYDVVSGARLWNLEEAGAVHSIVLSRDESVAYCCCEGGHGFVVDVRNGENYRRCDGLQKVWISGGADFRMERGAEVAVIEPDGRRRFIVESGGSPIIDVDYDRNWIAMAGVRGCLRVICAANGKEWMRQDLQPGLQFSKVALSDGGSVLRAIRWNYVSGGGMQLMECRLGESLTLVVAEIGEPAVALFRNGGRQLVTSDGMVVDCASGMVCSRIEFPMRKYRNS